MSEAGNFSEADHFFSGNYRALVENNGYDKDINGDSAVEDPEKLYRVQVRILGVHDFDSKTKIKTKYLPWASLILPVGFGGFGKDKTGTFYLPQCGSWVWVFFENCNVNKPVVQGVFIGKKDLDDFNIKSQYTTKIVTRSKAIIEVNDNINDDKDKLATQIKIITKGEQTLIISDEKDKERIELKTKDDYHLLLNNKDRLIELQTKDGNGITIDDDNKEIKILDANDNSIELTDGKIVIDNTDSSITMDGTKITLDDGTGTLEMDSGKFEYKNSSGNIKMSSSGEATINDNFKVKT